MTSALPVQGPRSPCKRGERDVVAAVKGATGRADASCAVEQEGANSFAPVAPSDQVERPGMNVEMVRVDVPSRRSAIADLAVLDGHGLAALDGVDQGPHGIPAATVVA